MKYNTFLFDWDGTLLDSLPIWYGIFQDVIKKTNANLTKEQQRKSYNRWDNMRDFVKIDDDTWQDVLKYSERIAEERLTKVPLIPGTLDMLKRLHQQKCTTALITRSYRKVVGNMLEEHNLIGGFDAVICIEDVKEHKPHPEPLLRAMEELGANPQETVMIGDGDGDIQAGHNAGIDSYLFWRPENKLYYKKSELLAFKPTKVFGSWDEFLKLVS